MVKDLIVSLSLPRLSFVARITASRDSHPRQFSEVRNMVIPFTREIAPNRAGTASRRSSRFKPGHKKQGGRKRGTPNLFSAAHKEDLLEAASRIGCDGNGRGGITGYFTWLALTHPDVYMTVVLGAFLDLELAGIGIPEHAPTLEYQAQEQVDLDFQFQVHVGRTGKCRASWKTARHVPDWTGQGYPLNALMHAAVETPRVFCKLLVKALLPRPSKPSPPRAPGPPAWPQG